MLEIFHFIRPLWLLALIPLALLAWRVYRPGGGDNPWRRIVDARLLPLLMAGGRTSVEPHGAVVGRRGLDRSPWWRSPTRRGNAKPQPVYQTTAARVVVLELSRSMNADRPETVAAGARAIQDRGRAGARRRRTDGARRLRRRCLHGVAADARHQYDSRAAQSAGAGNHAGTEAAAPIWACSRRMNCCARPARRAARCCSSPMASPAGDARASERAAARLRKRRLPRFRPGRRHRGRRAAHQCARRAGARCKPAPS